MMPSLADRFDALADRIVLGLAPRAEEHVLVSGGVHQFDLLSRVAVRVAALGAHPRIAVSSDDHAVRMALGVPAEIADRLPSSHDRYMASLYDAAVAIDATLDETAFAAVPVERRRLGATAGRILGDLARSARRRSIFMGWPAPAKAAACGMSPAAFEDLFLRAFLADPAAMEAVSAPVASAFRAGGPVRVTSAAGTDLRFALDPARRTMIDGGRFDMEMVAAGDITKNLPCGEVYTTPVESSVEGVAVFGLAFVDGAPIRDLRLRFERGRMIEATAAEGIDLFRRRYDAAQGDRDRLGELGVGTNPALRAPLGHTLLDEKIFGSIHLALGENRMYGGLNHATLHWDLVMLEPTLEVAGRTLLDRGRFTEGGRG